MGQVHDQKDGSDFEGTLTVNGGYDLEGDETCMKIIHVTLETMQNDLFDCDGTLINLTMIMKRLMQLFLVQLAKNIAICR